MQLGFDLIQQLSNVVTNAAKVEGFDDTFAADVRPADPRFGDFQSNGVLPYAKLHKTNPRALGTQLMERVRRAELIASGTFSVEIAGPGFINFTMSPSALLRWLQTYRDEAAFRAGAGGKLSGRKVIADYPSPNTAKQMHIGHLRPMVIGETVARLLAFWGADLTRDNHIGDWGTNFGTLIRMIKQEGYELGAPSAAPLAELEALYKRGTQMEKDDPAIRDESRAELVKLQQGDPENTQLWDGINKVSLAAQQPLYERLGVHTDITLGESFYRDKVERVYAELTEIGLAEESDGALVVWHDEIPKFSRESERGLPFIIRKKDGASNYATTDLACVLYRVEEMGAEEMVYFTDGRQQDHFQQLFLTVEKWFAAKGYPLPEMRHVWWGTILGEDGKAIKTRSGEPLRLQELLDEAKSRAAAIVDEKRPDLSPGERGVIAEAVGAGAVRYADLRSDRTQDYVFAWDRLLALEGNTAPYLQMAGARVHSIFRKAEMNPGDGEAEATVFETESELTLARKLIAFPTALETALSDLRPHVLCTYLYELAGDFSTFYNANKVIVDEPGVRARRLLLCARALTILETSLRLLGIEPLEQM